ncbi:unnamed protein product [Polarella glacialis]|nr:unnamed protein product [Polarella glacialis]
MPLSKQQGTSGGPVESLSWDPIGLAKVQMEVSNALARMWEKFKIDSVENSKPKGENNGEHFEKQSWITTASDDFPSFSHCDQFEDSDCDENESPLDNLDTPYAPRMPSNAGVPQPVAVSNMAPVACPTHFMMPVSMMPVQFVGVPLLQSPLRCFSPSPNFAPHYPVRRYLQPSRFHLSSASMGALSDQDSTFTNTSRANRLTVLSENQVHHGGVIRHSVRFTSGELSNADGVGFIFSSGLPCTKNIQKIVSVFANRTGRICIRAYTQVQRCDISVKPLELGDLLEVVTDLDQYTIEFTVWPASGSGASTVKVGFGQMLHALRRNGRSIRQACGYLAVVVKNPGVSVTMGS